MTRTSMIATAAGAALALALGGWAAADAARPAGAGPASAGRVLEVRYELRREPAYVPPPPSEATRLDVLNALPPTAIEEGVLSAQAGEALRSLQAQDAARSAAALAAIRAEGARIDRETAAALAGPRATDGGERESASAGG